MKKISGKRKHEKMGKREENREGEWTKGGGDIGERKQGGREGMEGKIGAWTAGEAWKRDWKEARMRKQRK